MIKVKAENLRLSLTVGARYWMSDKPDYKYEHRVSTIEAFLANVAIASGQSGPANLSTPQPIAPHASIARSQDANTPGVPGAEKSSQSSFYIATKPSSQIARQLWQSRITIAQGEKDEEYRNRLRHLIEQIRSIRFEPKNKKPEPFIALEPVLTVEPNETSSITEAQKERAENQVQPESDSRPPYEPVSDKTLQMLENLSQEPGQLRSPFELAELLFLSGHLKQAAVFYQHALTRQDPNDVGLVEDRAWIMFQIGNCLYYDDLPTAEKMYMQLIAEYPNCPWTDLAKARAQLIDWCQKDKPQTLIAECRPSVLPQAKAFQ